ncbi:MAG TPA: nucleotidyltransferase domain-containing protein [Ignavibacteria bacterium]|nr:nucleotidyltransferase domain-containing protein [Ignavibacteria bacterium]
MITKTKIQIHQPIGERGKRKNYLNSNEKEAVKEFTDRLKKLLRAKLINIILFGSKVRNVTNGESDIDILVLLKDKNKDILDRIVNVLVDIQLKYDANISPVIYSEYEFNMNLKLGSSFIKNVENEGIPL